MGGVQGMNALTHAGVRAQADFRVGSNAAPYTFVRKKCGNAKLDGSKCAAPIAERQIKNYGACAKCIREMKAEACKA